MSLPDIATWPLEVAAAAKITPRMRLLRLTGPILGAFEHLPGQDLALVIPSDGGRFVRRRYTIRDFDRKSRLLDFNVVLHGNGPGLRWITAARPGDRIDAVGPRGKIILDHDADWHLFAGDDTAVPGCFAMMEALSGEVPALVFLEIDGPEDEQALAADSGAARTVTWLYRGRSRIGGRARLVKAVASAEIPGGRGHAYLAGEVGVVQSLKQTLLERRFLPDQVSAKAYWNLGQSNLDRGEPVRRTS